MTIFSNLDRDAEELLQYHPVKNNDPIKLTVDEESYEVNGRDITCTLCITVRMGEDILFESLITKGKARCSETDTFDEEKGKKIAQTKASQKAYDKAYKYLIEAYINYGHIIDNMEKFRDKYVSATIRNIQYLDTFKKY